LGSYDAKGSTFHSAFERCDSFRSRLPQRLLRLPVGARRHGDERSSILDRKVAARNFGEGGIAGQTDDDACAALWIADLQPGQQPFERRREPPFAAERSHIESRAEAVNRHSGPVCTENLIRVDDVMESLKLAE
jgi:hypothetical protein